MANDNLSAENKRGHVESASSGNRELHRWERRNKRIDRVNEGSHNANRRKKQYAGMQPRPDHRADC